MKSLETINLEIEKFRKENPNSNFHFDQRRLPKLFRKFLEELLPEENVDKWLNDKDAYNGKSALDLLSELDYEKLTSNINQIKESVAYVLELVTGPGIPKNEHFYYLTRLSQYSQLKK